MQHDHGPLSRRALLAALVGGGTALAARAVGGAEVVSAATPPVRLGVSNTAYGDTVVHNALSQSTARGLHGRARGHGVAGTQTVTGNTGSLGHPANGVFGQAFSPSGNGVRGVANNGSIAYGVWGSALEGTGVVGQGPTGISGASFSTDGTGVAGTANTGAGAVGVEGASGGGYGVLGTGRVGVEGASAGGTAYGRLGLSGTGALGCASASNGTGVYGVANSGALAFGVWGRSTSGYAGYFSGDVEVTGLLAASAAGFLVDHPSDPTGRLLGQAYVSSHELLSTYSGNVTTDGRGLATVRLPAYVRALNGDFRYQLTVIGSFAQAIVDGRLSGRSFRIRTSEPGVEVSWQVTAPRVDAYARQVGFRAERVKRGAMAGRLLRPDLHGQDASRDLTALHRSRPMRRPARRPGAGLDAKMRTLAAGDDR